MPLADITNSGLDSALDEFHRIGLDAMLAKYSGSPSTEWFVQLGNWVYDPHLLLRAAHVSQGLGPLPSSGPKTLTSAQSTCHLEKLGCDLVGRLTGSTSNLASSRATEPLMRWLIGAARNRTTVAYGEAAARLHRECGFPRVIPQRMAIPATEMQSQIRALDPKAPLLPLLLVRASGGRYEIGMPGNGACQFLLARFPDEELLRNMNVRKEHPGLWSHLVHVATEEVYTYLAWECLYSRLYGYYVADPSYAPLVKETDTVANGPEGSGATDDEGPTTHEEPMQNADVHGPIQAINGEDHRKNSSNVYGRNTVNAKVLGDFPPRSLALGSFSHLRIRDLRRDGSIIYILQNIWSKYIRIRRTQ